ncbi:MAG TPA: response regulator [bacterium]|nr:response regulator [bacterium]
MVSLTKMITRSIRVLLVEDNLGDVTLMMEAFKGCKTPVQVFRVKDGEEAIQYLKRRGVHGDAHKPDLVLLDLNMPKKSGFEVLEEIKDDPALKEIPVVILTNSKLDSDIQRAYESRANFFMVKPSDLDGLFAATRYIEDIWLRSLTALRD